MAAAQGTAAPGTEPAAAAMDGLPAAGILKLVASGWASAPVLTSGSLAYDVRAARARDEPGSRTQLVTATLNARTYIYQPWLATLSGTLRLTSSATRTDGPAGGPLAGGGPVDSGDQFISGTARLDVFPKSRFPFELHLERLDSRIDSGLAPGIEFRSQNFGFSQRYQPASGMWRVNAYFDRREQATGLSHDVQNSMGADFSTRWKLNELSLGGFFSQMHRGASDDRSQFETLVARHQYSSEGPLSVNSLVNYTRTLEDVAITPSDLSVLQWSSVGLWHQLDSPLSVSGSVRGIMLREARSGQALDNVSVMAGANYDLSRNLRLSATAGASTTTSNGSSVLGLSTSGGINWQADSVEWRGTRYERFAAASASGSKAIGGSMGDAAQLAVQAQAGHSATRVWARSDRSGLSLMASQSLTLSRLHDSAADTLPLALLRTSLHNLAHSAALTWTANGDLSRAYARLTFSDSRELGGEGMRFQLVNFQLSGTYEFDRYRTLNGELTVQHTRQRAGEQLAASGLGLVAGERTGSTSTGGEISYRHQRPFGVPGLRFSSRLKLAQDVLRQPGMLPNLPDRETRLWESRLDWSVGRLESGVMFRLAQIDGKPREFLMLRVQRSFGD